MNDVMHGKMLAEQGKHMAHNMAEVFDISSQIGSGSSPRRCRTVRGSTPTR